MGDIYLAGELIPADDLPDFKATMGRGSAGGGIPMTLSEAAKVPLDKDFQALDELVASEKAKKEKKVVKVSKKTIK